MRSQSQMLSILKDAVSTCPAMLQCRFVKLTGDVLTTFPDAASNATQSYVHPFDAMQLINTNTASMHGRETLIVFMLHPPFLEVMLQWNACYSIADRAARLILHTPILARTRPLKYSQHLFARSWGHPLASESGTWMLSRWRT